MCIRDRVTAILQATRNLDQKKAAIYEQLMGELEPYGCLLYTSQVMMQMLIKKLVISKLV